MKTKSPLYGRGDVLVPKPYYNGFPSLTVMDDDGMSYRCRIPNGTVTIKIAVVDANYTEGY